MRFRLSARRAPSTTLAPLLASSRAVAEARSQLANASAWIIELRHQIPEARTSLKVLKRMAEE